MKQEDIFYVDKKSSKSIDTVVFSTGSKNDLLDTLDKQAKILFLDYGYYPAEISNIKFPSTNQESLEKGTLDTMNPRDSLPARAESKEKFPKEFYDLYDSLVKISKNKKTRNAISQRRVKIKYTPVIFKIEKEFTQRQIMDVIQKKTLFLDLTFRSKKLEKSKFSFSWNNLAEFEKLSGTLLSPTLEVVPGEIKKAEPDRIKIYNPNNFKIRYSVFLSADVNSKIVFKKISSKILPPRQSTEFESTMIFGSSAVSRTYSLSAYRVLPVNFSIANILVSRRIQAASIPSYETTQLGMTATTISTGAIINVKNVPDYIDLIQVFKKEYGYGEKQLLGHLTSDGYLFDTGLLNNSIYLYTAKFFTNGAVMPLTAEAVVRFLQLESVPVTFQLINQNFLADETTVTHQFYIKENEIQTTANQLLEDVVKSSQSDIYAAELEAAKAESTIISRYNIYRINYSVGELETVASNIVGNETYRFSSTNVQDNFTYIVELLASPLAAVSYKSVIAKQDVNNSMEYKFLFRKWRGKLTKDRQALPSTQEVNNNSLEEGMATSQTAVFKTLNFNAADNNPEIQKVVAEVDKINGCNWISWDYTGTTGGLNHFLILAQYNGIRAPIGAAVPIKSGLTGRFVYRDIRMFDIFGSVTYFIIPVFSELKYGVISSGASIFKKTSIPEQSLWRKR
tara:strand:- start:1257 stop:3293 length:2037 start_codon:yes stop_codon:yes gene_type:complete